MGRSYASLRGDSGDIKQGESHSYTEAECQTGGGHTAHQDTTGENMHSTVSLDELADFRLTSPDHSNPKHFEYTRKVAILSVTLDKNMKGSSLPRRRKMLLTPPCFLQGISWTENPDHLKVSHCSLDDLGPLDLNVTVL